MNALAPLLSHKIERSRKTAVVMVVFSVNKKGDIEITRTNFPVNTVLPLLSDVVKILCHVNSFLAKKQLKSLCEFGEIV
jgi:predicted transcriptional regulator